MKLISRVRWISCSDCWLICLMLRVGFLMLVLLLMFFFVVFCCFVRVWV